jgi:hypothetical protein
MLNGQLAAGLTSVVAPKTGEQLGYVFTEVNAQGQLQRWLLYRDPQNTFDLVAPSADMARWTLDDWKAGVGTLWKPGAYYVWAQTVVYAYGGTYGTVRWDRIPTSLPDPVFPRGDGNFQLDPTGWYVMQALQWSSGIWGMAFTVKGLADASQSTTGHAKSAEYWLLPNGFQPAGGGQRTSVSIGTLGASDLTSFVALCNERWTSGAAFAITGCANYTNDVPPAIVYR